MMISRISSMVTANSKVKDSISQDDYKTCCNKVFINLINQMLKNI